MELNNRVVLISGASSGIGKQLSIFLAREGCKLALLSRRFDELQKLSNLIQMSQENLKMYKCDVSDLEETRKIYRQIKNDFGKVDIAILNAGVSYRTDMYDLNIDQAKEIFDVNVFGILNFVKVLLPDFISCKSGCIVGVSSMADVRGFARSGFYSGSKAAASAILESLRIELKPHNIKVITVRPGFVKTPMTDKNEFRMPFLIRPEKAARIILEGIKKEKRIIQFPLPMLLITTLIKYLPNSLFEYLSSKKPPQKNISNND